MLQRAILTGMFVIGLSAHAHASCVCRCVEGHMRALCSTTLDIPPICPATICVIPPPAIAPLKPARIPPLGTFQCEQRQVLNPATQQYEWHQVCQ